MYQNRVEFYTKKMVILTSCFYHACGLAGLENRARKLSGNGFGDHRVEISSQSTASGAGKQQLAASCWQAVSN